MAKRGLVSLTDSDGQTFKLRFGTNAICDMQKALGRPLGQILKTLNPDDLDFLTVRTMVKAAVVDPKDVSDEVIGDFIDDVGLDKVTSVISGVFGKASDADPGKPSGEGSESIAPLTA